MTEEAVLSELLAAFERVAQQLERVVETVEAISDKLDRANELLASIDRSQRN